MRNKLGKNQVIAYEQLENFAHSVCDSYALAHALDVTDMLEFSVLQKRTPTLILNVFRRLYENGDYDAMTQLILCMYDLGEQYYPRGVHNVRNFADVALKPYCDSLMEHLDKEITELYARMPD